MLPTLRRLPLLAAILALSLVVGPAASALCPHPGDEMATHDMPAESPEAPCHEGMGEMPASPTPDEAPPHTTCDAPCCLAATTPSALTLAPSGPALVVASVEIVEAAQVQVHEGAPVSTASPPTPQRLYLETGRVRV